LTRIRTMIVDDEPAARRLLRESCEAAGDLEVVSEHGTAQAALEAIRAGPPQLLFLDIQMVAMTGMDLARSLEPTAMPLIVFVTAYDRYAVEAFEVNAIDYLLKPFDDARFARALERVRQRLSGEGHGERAATLDALLAALTRENSREPGGKLRLLTATHGRQIFVDPAAVRLAEADRNYVRLRVGVETHLVRATLLQIEQALESPSLLKVSRSCLVNMQFVQEVNRTPRGDFILVLVDGTTVTSSEGFRERVRRFLDRLRI
jgi:two-component system, LytTR family, response regulator